MSGMILYNASLDDLNRTVAEGHTRILSVGTQFHHSDVGHMGHTVSIMNVTRDNFEEGLAWLDNDRNSSPR